MKYNIHNLDNIEFIKNQPDDTYDHIISDPPYNKIASKWDTAIDLDWMWREFDRITGPDAHFIFTAAQPFCSKLVISKLDWFKHDWIWEKPNGQGQVKYGPNRVHEHIVVFAKNKIQYQPQMTKGKPYIWDSVRSKNTDHPHWKGDHRIENTGQRYPRSVQKIKQQRGLHPTQKPVELFDLLVKSYTKENEHILDPYMGSGTTGLACIANKRSFTGIEKDATYFKTASARIIDGIKQTTATSSQV